MNKRWLLAILTVFAVNPTFVNAASLPPQESPRYVRVYEGYNRTNEENNSIQLVLGQQLTPQQVQELIVSINRQLAEGKDTIEIIFGENFSKEEAAKLLAQLRLELNN